MNAFTVYDTMRPALNDALDRLQKWATEPAGQETEDLIPVVCDVLEAADRCTDEIPVEPVTLETHGYDTGRVRRWRDAPRELEPEHLIPICVETLRFVLWVIGLWPSCEALHPHGRPLTCIGPRGHRGDHYGVAWDAGSIRDEARWPNADDQPGGA